MRTYSILLATLSIYRVEAAHHLPDTCPSAIRISEPVCGAGYDGNVAESQNQQQAGEAADNNGSVKFSWRDTGLCVRDYCLFANQGFNRGRGISVISTLENMHKVKDVVNEVHSQDQARRLPDPAQFYVAEVPGKGLGLIANASLHRGTPIMHRTPALLVHRNFLEQLPPQEQQSLLDAAVELLPPATRSLFLSQMGHFGGHKITDILATNSFQTDLGGKDGHHYSNYPEVSRFNHDCRPNVAFYISEQLVHTTTAVRSVEPGEELTITYMDSFEPRAARQERALQTWGFKCTCSQCSLPDKLAAKSDKRLEEIASIQTQLAEFQDANVTPALIRRYIKLYKDDNLDFAIAGAYTLAALNYNMLGDEKMAVKYAKLAVEAGSLEHGPPSSDVSEMRALLRSPKGHFSWRRRWSGW
ncbi:SET domain-containing protein [Coniochaeta ligniaria NRRL 30616]|uniref:SET domain-containing protein n=1 Tax=Coniochaeta ligniaria NRRL 30616 TaxID=1408157 RepID=A0A1J7IZ58_9PEZI|nr:SET domain-containing protein [Coniochaeta ligniaria NRRL 30616]